MKTAIFLKHCPVGITTPLTANQLRELIAWSARALNTDAIIEVSTIGGEIATFVAGDVVLLIESEEPDDG